MSREEIIVVYTIAELMCPLANLLNRVFATQLTVNDDKFACPLLINSTQSLAIMIHNVKSRQCDSMVRKMHKA